METDSSIAPASDRELSKSRSKFRMDLQVWARDIVLSLFIAAAVIVFLCQPVKVEGTSMLPQLEDEQRIFVNKLVYRIDSIERRDVVVFRFPEDPSRSYIKRVIGLPGETVEVRKGTVHIDGQALLEPYVPHRYRDRASHPPVTVPEGGYYLLGDHRITSNDSRTWGTVDKGLIKGKAVFAYWPPERFGVVQ